MIAEDRLESDASRASALAARFRASFGETPRVYRSPGRVNLIGEHTDYNEGFVLPAAIAQACWVAAAPRDDGRLIVESDNMDSRVECDLSGTEPAPSGRWSDYAVGVAVMLRRAGHAVAGAALVVRGDVPLGAGLSSSAALEVGVASALLDLAGARLDGIEVARICQRAENEFVGARSGVMDQFVAVHGRAGRALLIDCRSLEHCDVPIPRDVRLVACNTMVGHEIAGGEYNRRREECEEGVARLATRLPGVRSLRDVDAVRLEACRRDLSDVVFRRCRHVVTENGRVQQAAAALRAEDLDAVGALMAESHRSLRDDYQVSCPELDVMVEIAGSLPGVYGARMTGGGFGGCTINLVHADAVAELCRRVEAEYKATTGRRPEIYVTEAGGGAARMQ